MSSITEMTGGTYPLLNAGDNVEFPLKTYQFRPPYCARSPPTAKTWTRP
jgi:hypothetical protein